MQISSAGCSPYLGWVPGQGRDQTTLCRVRKTTGSWSYQWPLEQKYWKPLNCLGLLSFIEGKSPLDQPLNWMFKAKLRKILGKLRSSRMRLSDESPNLFGLWLCDIRARTQIITADQAIGYRLPANWAESTISISIQNEILSKCKPWRVIGLNCNFG